MWSTFSGVSYFTPHCACVGYEYSILNVYTTITSIKCVMKGRVNSYQNTIAVVSISQLVYCVVSSTPTLYIYTKCTCTFKVSMYTYQTPTF